VVPYLDLLIKNGLAERVEGENCSLQDHSSWRGGAAAHAGAREADCGNGRRRGGVKRYDTSQAAVDFAGDETQAF